MQRSRIKSILATKLTKTQIIFSGILLFILITGLTVFFFSTYTGMMLRYLTYLSLLQAESALTQLITPPPPTLAPTPTEIAIPTVSAPTITPGATPIEQLPNISPDKLIVYQTRYGHENTATITKTITDTTKVKELYEEIKSLPFWPQGVINCPMDTGLEYVLDFYFHEALFVHALLNATGCPGVTFTKYKARMALSPQGRILIEDLRQTLQLSPQNFYGYR